MAARALSGIRPEPGGAHPRDALAALEKYKLERGAAALCVGGVEATAMAVQPTYDCTAADIVKEPPMPAPIEFYFDFSSPYGYIASTQIETIAEKHGRSVSWHPVLLGAVFKLTGGVPLASIPLKGEYSARDMARSARLLGVPFGLPSKFPIATQAAARLTVWAQQRNADDAKKLAGALYRAYFAENRDISNADVCADIGAACGHDRAQALAGLNDAAIKDRLRQKVDDAIARKVFGSPYFIVDGEPFWGADRLGHVERWLATGGW